MKNTTNIDLWYFYVKIYSPKMEISLGKIKLNYPATLVVAFLAYVATAHWGLYLYKILHIQPFLFWPVAGVTLSAIILGGNRVWPAIALGSLFVHFVNKTSWPMAGFWILISTIQPLIGAYILKRFNFSYQLMRLRDVFLLLITGMVISMIIPSVILGVNSFLHTFQFDTKQTWLMWWLGQSVSIAIATPFLISLARPKTYKVSIKGVIESIIVGGSLIAILYVSSWRGMSAIGGIPVVFPYLVLLFWTSLRMGTRRMAAALAGTFSLAILGIVYRFTHDVIGSTDVVSMVLSLELFYLVLAAIFLALSSISEEREVTTRALKDYIDRLKVALDRIKTADKAKGQYISILAHELRNPLAPVISYLEILQKTGLKDPKAEEYLEVISRNVHTTTRLLDYLLDISRVEHHKIKLDKERIILQESIRRAISTVEPKIKEENRELTINLPEEDIIIEADPVRLDQVLINLLNNAVKYTKRNGHIHFDCKLDSDVIIISVKDDGVGIVPAMMDKIFNPFFQAYIQSISTAGGLGVGLFLSKNFVELHGGTLVARSAGADQGSEFIISLPNSLIKTEIPAGNGQVKNSTPKTDRGGKKKKKLRILIVDDNEQAAEGLSKLLSLVGYEVEIAHNGMDALKLAKTFLPDVVFLDIGLPEVDGYQVAKNFREQGQPVCLIALTGYGQIDDKAKAIEAGFDYHLTKPVGIAEIEEILNQL